MAHTEEMLVHGVITPVIKYDSSAQDIDDAARKSLWQTNPNLLDNWYFADPINQIGQTEYAANGYTIDRWRAYNGATVTLTDEGVSVSYSGTGTWRRPLVQIVEVPKAFRGKTVTVSSLIKDATDNVYFSGAVDGASKTGTFVNGSGISSSTFTVSETAETIEIGYLIRQACSFTAVATKMELGDTQTLAHQDAHGNWVLNDPPPNKALELAKCQRYQFMTLGDSVRASFVLPNGIYFFVPTPTTMRSIPAISVNNLSVRTVSAAEPSTGFSFSATAIRPNGVWIAATKASHGMTDAALDCGAKPLFTVFDANL